MADEEEKPMVYPGLQTVQTPNCSIHYERESEMLNVCAPTAAELQATMDWLVGYSGSVRTMLNIKAKAVEKK